MRRAVCFPRTGPEAFLYAEERCCREKLPEEQRLPEKVFTRSCFGNLPWSFTREECCTLQNEEQEAGLALLSVNRSLPRLDLTRWFPTSLRTDAGFVGMSVRTAR